MTDQLATSAHFDEVASLPLLTWSSGVEGFVKGIQGIQGKAGRRLCCVLPHMTSIVSHSQWELQIDQKIAFACVSDVFHFTVH